MLAGLGALQPLLTRMIIDQGLISRSYTHLWTGCAGMLALGLTSMLLGAWHRRLYVSASGQVLFALRERVYAHLLAVYPRQLESRPVGDIVSRMDGDIAEIQRFGMDAVAGALNGALGLVAAFVVMVTLSWRLSLLVALLLPVQLLIRHYAKPRIERNARAVREQSAAVGAFLIETINLARGIVGLTGEAREQRRLQQLQGAYLERVIQQQMLGVIVGGAAAFVGYLVTATIFMAGGWAVIRGSLTLGTLIAFVTYFGRGAGSAGSMLALYTGYQRVRVSLQRVNELFALPTIPERACARPMPNSGGEVSFRGVTVKRPDGSAVLDDLTVTILRGSKTRIAGPSGVGKTTVADLMRRFIDPDAGTIDIDGIDIRDVKLGDLRRRVAVLEQTPVLIAGTLWDNLTYGVPVLQDHDVLLAAAKCGVSEIAAQLPDGFQSVIGERGAGLSSGQCQRIAIARLLLRDPLIIVLDEATNALDRESRDQLDKLVDTTFADKTRIVITHAGDERGFHDVIQLSPPHHA